MTSFTPEHFLNGISPDAPCGESLETDPVFAQLESAAKFIGERQMGSTIIPEVEPDWRKVRDLSITLLRRSLDIQVAMHLTCALLHTDGFLGLAQGLSLIDNLLKKYWDDVYPRPDPGDDYPILRVNTLGTLKDYKKVLGPIAKTKLIQSKAGSFSWHEIELAKSKLTATGNSADMALIDGAFSDSDVSLETLKQQYETLKQALKHLQGIVDWVGEKSGSANVPDLSPLINLLKSIAKFLDEKIQPRSGQKTTDSLNMENAEMVREVLETGMTARGKSDGIHSRDEVSRALDAICKYFECYEPSSPIPFLLLRAKKLLSLNFMEIMRELAPDAIKQAENVCGVQQKDKN